MAATSSFPAKSIGSLVLSAGQRDVTAIFSALEQAKDLTNSLELTGTSS